MYSVLAGLPQATIDPLQRVQNAAARLVAGIGTRTGSHHPRSQKPALATDQATYKVQAVRVFAPGARRSQFALPG